MQGLHRVERQGLLRSDAMKVNQPYYATCFFRMSLPTSLWGENRQVWKYPASRHVAMFFNPTNFSVVHETPSRQDLLPKSWPFSRNTLLHNSFQARRRKSHYFCEKGERRRFHETVDGSCGISSRIDGWRNVRWIYVEFGRKFNLSTIKSWSFISELKNLCAKREARVNLAFNHSSKHS